MITHFLPIHDIDITPGDFKDYSRIPLKLLFFSALLSFLLFIGNFVYGQHHHSHTNGDVLPLVTEVEAQPLVSQALRISEALAFAGSPLTAKDFNELHVLSKRTYNEHTVRKIQEILDPYCLALVDINPESRVMVMNGPAVPKLMQAGWTTFLVKIHNKANVTAKLTATSPNAQPVVHRSTYAPRMAKENAITKGELENRFLEISINRNAPLNANLSGFEVEYAVMHIYSDAVGKREGKIGFHVGQGTQDIGFRNTLNVLFEIQPAVKVVFDVKDENNSPIMASFIITDGIERFNENSYYLHHGDYRLSYARIRDFEKPISNKGLSKENRLIGIYPLPARRLALEDDFPDFFFQPQIYRRDGEYVYLPPGEYKFAVSRGPEYKNQVKHVHVPNKDSIVLKFRPERWIHMADYGWYSYDHHIHAAGCSHYESPEEGVLPEHMWRQLLGEDLNVGSNLSWAPSWFFQKQFFTGKEHSLSTDKNVLRYDVEVSGFPSSHAGHVALLNLKEDDYPNTTEVEDWPSWTLPVLKWAKKQGALTGYAHSGWGLDPITPTFELPNYITPKMDGIGANEYVVTVTHDVVDFYALGNTSAPAELNMWYHTLNCGFRPRASGETDFPCISDERVGLFRTYAGIRDSLNFSNLMTALEAGRTYVSDGYSHLIDFSVNDVMLGYKESELSLSAPADLTVSVKAAAMLSQDPNEVEKLISSRELNVRPYWHVERARIDSSRKVAVELVVNGAVVDTTEITADGDWEDLRFKYRIEKSSWIAVRIYPSAHTNPIFVLVDEKPIIERKSAEWCIAAVDQCWKMKMPQIKESELNSAKQAYDYARRIYKSMISDEGN